MHATMTENVTTALVIIYWIVDVYFTQIISFFRAKNMSLLTSALG